jgi:uncharacterized alkaline shock family protein YloU
MMEGTARISGDVLGSYAADAALEVPGVRGIVASHLPRQRGVRVSTSDDGEVRVELHLDVDWGASIPQVGCAVQQRVRDYLAQMADVHPSVVDVVVDEIGPVA